MADTKTSPRLSKNIGDIRSALFSKVEAVQDDYAAKGWLPIRLNLNKGIVRGILELFAWGLWQLYNFLDRIHQQAIPLQASGNWLDTHAAQVGEIRKAATKARGHVRFFRGSASGNIRIPEGRIVRTKPDGKGAVYRYSTDALAVLQDGQESVAVLVTAEEYGQASNASVGQICELVTPVEGIGGVSNDADWLTEEGADEEADASLRERYVLAWKARAGVTRAAYEAAALSVPGVVNVFISDQHPRGEGTVDVIVQSSAGLPTENLLAQVRAAIDSSIVINHDLLVKAPEAVSVSVRMTLELLSGDEENIKEQAESWVREMFSARSGDDVPRFSIGKDVVRDRLASGIVSIPGVKRIRWAAPLGDVSIPVDGLAVLAELDIQTVWIDEA